jgi:hypothetical protein
MAVMDSWLLASRRARLTALRLIMAVLLLF